MPCCTISPRSRTRILSAFSIVLSRCATITTVWPFRFLWSACCTTYSDSASRALVASSSRRIRGFRIRARAIAILDVKGLIFFMQMKGRVQICSFNKNNLPLLLTATQLRTSLAAFGVVNRGRLAYERVCIGHLGRAHHSLCHSLCLSMLIQLSVRLFLVFFLI